MGLRINTNVASLSAQRQLTKQQERGDHALAAVSSGSRIVRSSDDAAGLAISENLRGQIAGMVKASDNANNAISLMQTGEGGLNEVSNILIRLRELGIQSASDNISDTERGFLNLEAKQLIEEGDRIAKTTRFGNKQLLDGTAGEMTFHVGTFAGDENRIKYNMNADATSGALGYSGVSIADRDGARDSLEKIDTALTNLSKIRAGFGSIQSRLQSTVSNLGVQHENLSAANSRLRDADMAHETAEMAQSQILEQAGVSALAQANQSKAIALKLLA